MDAGGSMCMGKPADYPATIDVPRAMIPAVMTKHATAAHTRNLALETSQACT
jgi:hypothetical protein